MTVLDRDYVRWRGVQVGRKDGRAPGVKGASNTAAAPIYRALRLLQ
jgi:hypothetical protein